MELNGGFHYLQCSEADCAYQFWLTVPQARYVERVQDHLERPKLSMAAYLAELALEQAQATGELERWKASLPAMANP